MNIYKICVVKFIINGERQNCLPQRLGIRQGCSLLTLVFNIVVAGLATTIGKKKKEKA